MNFTIIHTLSHFIDSLALLHLFISIFFTILEFREMRHVPEPFTKHRHRQEFCVTSVILERHRQSIKHIDLHNYL